MVTREEAAKYLRISTRTLDRLVRSGKIRSYKYDRAVRIKRQELERFLKQQEQS